MHWICSRIWLRHNFFGYLFLLGFYRSTKKNELHKRVNNFLVGLLIFFSTILRKAWARRLASLRISEKRFTFQNAIIHNNLRSRHFVRTLFLILHCNRNVTRVSLRCRRLFFVVSFETLCGLQDTITFEWRPSVANVSCSFFSWNSIKPNFHAANNSRQFQEQTKFEWRNLAAITFFLTSTNIFEWKSGLF